MVSRYIENVPTRAALVQEQVAYLRRLIPNWVPRSVGSPAVYWFDYLSDKLVSDMDAYNLSVDQNDILLATGAELDYRLMQYGVFTEADLAGKTDAQKRLLWQQLWQGITSGTSANDINRASNAAPNAGSIARTPIDWAANSVGVYVIDSMGDNLTGLELDTVRAALNHPDRDTFWLDYTVEPATIDHYLVSGYIVYDPRESDPLVRVKAGLETVMLALRLLDTGIDDSTLVLMLGRLGLAPSHNVERAELSLNITTASMDEDGTLIVGDEVSALDPLVDTVRWGHIDAFVNTPDDTEVRTVWSASNANPPAFSARRGTVQSATVPGAGINTYLWLRIEETGKFSDLALETNGTPITMNQVLDNVWVSNATGAGIEALKVPGNTPINVHQVTREWPGIESRMKW